MATIKSLHTSISELAATDILLLINEVRRLRSIPLKPVRLKGVKKSVSGKAGKDRIKKQMKDDPKALAKALPEQLKQEILATLISQFKD